MVLESIKRRKVYFIIIALILFIIGGICFYQSHNNNSIVLIDNDDKAAEYNREYEGDNSKENDNLNKEEIIMVHISGQVKRPGVIKMTEGARLVDAIEELGGATEKADLDCVNLAQRLKDEEKIYIPKIGENVQENIVGNINNSSQNSDIININTASLEELKSLSGIGDVIGGNIIEYREVNGGFKNIEEIKKVNRIGEKIFNDIKDKIGI